MFTLDNNLCNMPHKHKCLKRKWVCKNQILWPKKCWFWNHFKYCLSNTKHPLTKKLLHIIGACMRATCIVYNASWCQRIWWSAILKFYVALFQINICLHIGITNIRLRAQQNVGLYVVFNPWGWTLHTMYKL